MVVFGYIYISHIFCVYTTTIFSTNEKSNYTEMKDTTSGNNLPISGREITLLENYASKA